MTDARRRWAPRLVTCHVLLTALLISETALGSAPGVPTSDTKDVPPKAEAQIGQRPGPFEIGAQLSLEPTWLAQLYVMARDQGLADLEGKTWLRGGAAPLTGMTGYRVELERWQSVLKRRSHRVEVLLGLRYSGGSDYSARQSALGTLFGLRYGVTLKHSQFGIQAAYVTAPFTWLTYSEAYRASFEDRYPSDRDTVGPKHNTLYWASHRVQAAFTFNLGYQHWSLWTVAGLQWSPGAGSNWANLELGQLPLLISSAVGYRF